MNIIGVSTRLCAAGERHPYMVTLNVDGRPLSSLVALPSDKSYITPPVHPLYGNLEKGAEAHTVENALKSHLKGKKVFTHEANRNMNIFKDLDVEYIDVPLPNHGEEAQAQITALQEEKERRQAA